MAPTIGRLALNNGFHGSIPGDWVAPPPQNIQGALMWICGIILEVIVKKHRQLYELMLNQMNITLSQKKDDAKTDD